MIRRTRTALGTFVEISASGDEAENAIEEAFKTIQTIEEKTSFYLPDSDVSRINTLEVETPLKIDQHTYTVLLYALELSALSKGLFDITIGSTLVEENFLPSSSLQSELSSSWHDIDLQRENHLSLRQPVCIDLGGIAKGYAVDNAIEAMSLYKVNSACVNAGGDLRVFGTEQTPLLLRHPVYPSETVSTESFLNNNAAATSAGYYSRSVNGLLPIVDPYKHTCIEDESSITIIAQECMIADALTKVVMLSADSVLPLLHHYGARALILRCDRAKDHSLLLFDSDSVAIPKC